MIDLERLANSCPHRAETHGGYGQGASTRCGLGGRRPGQLVYAQLCRECVAAHGVPVWDGSPRPTIEAIPDPHAEDRAAVLRLTSEQARAVETCSRRHESVNGCCSSITCELGRIRRERSPVAECARCVLSGQPR